MGKPGASDEEHGRPCRQARLRDAGEVVLGHARHRRRRCRLRRQVPRRPPGVFRLRPGSWRAAPSRSRSRRWPGSRQGRRSGSCGRAARLRPLRAVLPPTRIRPCSVVLPVAGKAGAKIPNAEPERARRASIAATVSAAGWPRSVESIFLKRMLSLSSSLPSAARCFAGRLGCGQATAVGVIGEHGRPPPCRHSAEGRPSRPPHAIPCRAKAIAQSAAPVRSSARISQRAGHICLLTFRRHRLGTDWRQPRGRTHPTSGPPRNSPLAP